MALVDQGHGTQTATIGTEHTLATLAIAGVFVLSVNTKNMVNGDITELRLYKKILTGDSSETLVEEAHYANQQGDGAGPGSSAGGAVIKVSIPIDTLFSYKATLKQVAGTGRAYDWVVDSLE